MRRAQSLVEFALIAPVVILLAMAAWDGGGVLRDQVILDQAARDGARVAAMYYASTLQTTSVCAAVSTSAADLGSVSCGATNITYPANPPGSVQVQLSWSHALFTPVLRQLWSGGQGTITMHASATFFLPAQTQVPNTVVPSTATPTPTPTPTPRPTATPSPTATAVPQFTCSDNNTFLTVNSLAPGTGEAVPFSVVANDTISATWFVPQGTSGLQLTIYRGSAPGGTPVSTMFAFDTFIFATTGAPVSTVGTYSVYFFNSGSTTLPGGTLAVVNCT